MDWATQRTGLFILTAYVNNVYVCSSAGYKPDLVVQPLPSRNTIAHTASWNVYDR